MSMMIVGGVMFVLSTQPMMVITSLILIVLLYSFYLFWGLSSFWYGYMLVLVLMSGVLVVFTYMMSVLPNESFEVSSLVMMIMGMILIFNYFGVEEFVVSSIESSQVWGGVTMNVSLFLVVYLLMMMIAVVWVSTPGKGAIRAF